MVYDIRDRTSYLNANDALFTRVEKMQRDNILRLELEIRKAYAHTRNANFTNFRHENCIFLKILYYVLHVSSRS